MFGIAVAPRFGITYYSLGVGLHRGGGSDLLYNSGSTTPRTPTALAFLGHPVTLVADSFLFHVPVLEKKKRTPTSQGKKKERS